MIKDTFIDSKLFQIVKGIEASRLDSILLNRTIYGNKIDTLLLPDYYFYTEDDRVYLKKVDGSLQFLWDSSPAVNDIWRYGLQYDSVSNSFKEPFLKVTGVDYSSHSCGFIPVKDSIGTPFIQSDSTAYVPYFLITYYSFWGFIDLRYGPRFGFNLLGQFGSYLDLTTSKKQLELVCYESTLSSFELSAHHPCNALDTTLVTIDENRPLLKSLYPNPASDNVTLLFKSAENSKTATIEIRDVTGKLVDVLNINANTLQNYSTGKLTNSFYFATLFIDGKLIKQQKLVLVK